MDFRIQLPMELNTNTYIILAAVLCGYFFIYPIYFGPFSHVPGPPLGKISWYYIFLYDFWLRRNLKITQWHQKYGPMVCYRPGEVSISDPDIARDVYGTAGRYTRSDLADTFMAYGERPIFATRSVQDHQRKRKAVVSFYHKSTLSRPVIQDFIREYARKVVVQIENHMEMPLGCAKMDVYPLFNRFSFDIITRLQLGAEYGTKTIENECRERDILVGIKQGHLWGPLRYNFPWLTLFLSKMLSKFPKAPWNLLIPRTLQLFLTSEAEFEAWGWETINAAAKHSATLEDYTLLSRLLGLKEKEDSEMTHKYVVAEVFDQMVAAENNIAVGLIYLSYHLAWYPDWQRAIRDELKALPRNSDGYPTFADIDCLGILEAFMREVTRVNPGSGGRSERNVKKGGQTFKGIYLPDTTRICLSTISFHQRQNAFYEPEKFLPERWLNRDEETKRRMEYSFSPFGLGPRSCIARDLAWMEEKIMIAHLLLRFEFEPVKEMGDGKTGPLWQSGALEAVPIGLRCDIVFRKIEDTS